MIGEWQTIEKQVPSKWMNIDEAGSDYQISNIGTIRKICKSKAKGVYYREMRLDGNNIKICKIKYNIPRLLNKYFGLTLVDKVDGEMWIDIIGFENLYQVSNIGRIRSKPKMVARKDGRQYYVHERIIKPTHINSGYKIINLHKDKQLFHFLIHRLVAIHFIPNLEQLPCVNHKDEDKHNNQVENLEWCTKRYNDTYGTAQLRRVESRRKNNNGNYYYGRNNKQTP